MNLDYLKETYHLTKTEVRFCIIWINKVRTQPI